MLYHLPCSPQLRCFDRFSVLDDNAEGSDGLVPLWPVVRAILSRNVNTVRDIVDALDEIAVTLRDRSSDYGTLVKVLGAYPNICTAIWPKLIQLALAMPTFFEGGTLPILRPGDRLTLSRPQAACLVAHQFLATLARPAHRGEDGWYDFSIWYDSAQPHPVAAEMYITAVCEYFRTWNAERQGEVWYELHATSNAPNFDVPLSPVKILLVEEHTTDPQRRQFLGSSGAMVVSANKVIGFGQYATQEEMYLANTPESCPAVLVTPVLGAGHVLVICGAQPILDIRGERRSVSWKLRGPASLDNLGGTMLLMDALELDIVVDDDDDDANTNPNLLRANITRELVKATTAFSSSSYSIVFSPLWGCGAFCGDPAVKMIILWLAASAARVPLAIFVDARQRNIAVAFENVVAQWAKRGVSAATLVASLNDVPPDLRGIDVLTHGTLSG